MGGNIGGEKQGTFDIGEVKSLVFVYFFFFTRIYILTKNDKVINDFKCAQRLQIGSEHEGR